MKTRMIFLCLLFLSSSAFGEKQNLSYEDAVKFIQKSEDVISGEQTKLGIIFSSILLRPESVTVDIYLKSANRLKGEINYATKTYDIRFVSSKTDELAKLTKEDLLHLHVLYLMLAKHLPVSDMTRTVDALMSILNLLEGYPSDEYFEIIRNEPLSLEVWTSLCANIGQQHTGAYDIVEGTPIAETRTVGPCASGDCFGRCGPNCGSPPGPAIQRFTAECFNHDLCAGATGEWFGPCWDEWKAAADGFLFGTDCNSVTGDWQVETAGTTCFQGNCGDIYLVETYHMSSRGTAFNGKTDPNPKDRRIGTLKGNIGNPTADSVNGSWRIPGYMASECQSKPDGYGKGPLQGTNRCGSIATNATGTWGWYYIDSCTHAGDGAFAGTITAIRSDRLGNVSTMEVKEVKQDDNASGISPANP